MASLAGSSREGRGCPHKSTNVTEIPQPLSNVAVCGYTTQMDGSNQPGATAS